MPARSFIIPSSGRSGSSLRNPCPPGTGIGNMDWNGTFFVICDAAFYKDTSADELALGLGLGLGLGIPFLCIIIGIIVCQCRHMIEMNKFKISTSERIAQYYNPGSMPPPLSDEERLKLALSADAFNDFKAGALTDRLKEEIMIYRVKEGRDLIDFVRYANSLSHEHIASYCDNLFPGSFPQSIFVKARYPSSQPKEMVEQKEYEMV